MNDILVRQLGLDYCCSEDDVRDESNHFSPWKPLPGRRLFDDDRDYCFLKLAVVNGKLLVTGDAILLKELEEKMGRRSGIWFMDAGPLSSLDRILNRYGWEIDQFHEFFLAEDPSEQSSEGFDLTWYEKDTISSFEGDERFEEAFCFSPDTPDVLGVSASKDGVVLGMAGASEDSPFLWQIGINVLPEAEGSGVGSLLVSLLKDEVLKRGKLPYYGTAMSHLASQRIALKAGFLPAWVELIVTEVKP